MENPLARKSTPSLPHLVEKATRPAPALPRASEAMPTSPFRGDSGIREAGRHPANDGVDVEEGTDDGFDMSSFEDPEPSNNPAIIEPEPEPEELSDAYLEGYMVQVPEGKDAKDVRYTEDVRREMDANNYRKLNEGSSLSREVDLAFAKAKRRPGPPPVPPPPGTSRPLPEQGQVKFGDKVYVSKTARRLANDPEATGVYDMATLHQQLRKMRVLDDDGKETQRVEAFNRADLPPRLKPVQTTPEGERVIAFDREQEGALREAIKRVRGDTSKKEAPPEPLPDLMFDPDGDGESRPILSARLGPLTRIHEDGDIPTNVLREIDTLPQDQQQKAIDDWLTRFGGEAEKGS